MHKTKLFVARAQVTEKATLLKENGQYIFKVSCQETKATIRTGIEKMHGVKVTAVNTIKMKGKARRVGQINGRRKNWKKAYVTLAEGHTIDLSNEQTKE